MKEHWNKLLQKPPAVHKQFSDKNSLAALNMYLYFIFPKKNILMFLIILFYV